MRGILFSFMLLSGGIFGLLLIAPNAWARVDGGGVPGQDGGGEPGGITIPNPLQADTIPELLDNIVDFLILISAPILTIMVLWAGFLFLVSGGDPNKVVTARNALIWSAVGFAVILISKGITLIIKEILGGGA